MRSTFFNLPEPKRQRFLAACAEEFAAYGYELASTNRIVAKLDIAKGTFFKYAASKEDVFLYLVEDTLAQLGRLQATPDTFSSADILVRAQELFERQMQYALREPDRYRLVLRAYLETGSAIYPRLAELRDRIAAGSGNAIYAGVDWSMYRFPQGEVRELLGLLDLGIRQGAREALAESADVSRLRAYAMGAFELARRVLRSGIYSGSTGRDGE